MLFFKITLGMKISPSISLGKLMLTIKWWSFNKEINNKKIYTVTHKSWLRNNQLFILCWYHFIQRLIKLMKNKRSQSHLCKTVARRDVKRQMASH